MMRIILKWKVNYKKHAEVCGFGVIDNGGNLIRKSEFYFKYELKYSYINIDDFLLL